MNYAILAPSRHNSQPWEFAIEGHRRTDMIRFGVFTTKTWFNHKPNGTFRTLFAIPQGAIQTNNKLKQNTGY